MYLLKPFKGENLIFNSLLLLPPSFVFLSHSPLPLTPCFMIYEFPAATVITYHKPGGLQQEEHIFSQVSRPEVWNQGIPELVPSGFWGEMPFLTPLLVSHGCANPWCSFIYSQITLISTPSSYHLHHHLHLISFLPFSSLVMTLVIHLGPLQTSMISSEILNYMLKDAFFPK